MLLPGGGGRTWLVGEVAVKPASDPEEASWRAQVFSTLSGPGFRVPRPVRSKSGAWVVDGWEAWERIEGEAGAVRHWPELVAVSRAFHAALAGVAPPAWLGQADNPWSRGDRFAWGEDLRTVASELQGQVEALRGALRPIALPSQLIHGDIGGNVLFAPGQTPAVIDFGPYFRPAGYALAIAAVDALTWSGAPPSILDALADEPEIDQLLARALLYRLVTESCLRQDPETLAAVRAANEPVVELVLARLAGRAAPAAYLSDDRLAALVAECLGEPAVQVRPLSPAAGGHTRAVCRLARRTDGTTVFVKAAGPGAGGQVAGEIGTYAALGRVPFAPVVAATALAPVPLLILEALPDDGWVTEWTAEIIGDAQRLLDEVHALAAPAGLRRLADPDAGGENPWEAIEHDPQRLLRMQVCDRSWLTARLPVLRTAAAGARLAGPQLVHMDVQAANLCYRDGRLVLADWGAAAAGAPWLDRHLWLVALHAEGGPAPDALQGPGAAEHAAWIAGRQVLLAPARDSDPALFTLRRRRLAVALEWAARRLDLPPPVLPAGAAPLA